MSPVANQPSTNDSAVAFSFFQYSRNTLTPLARISLSGAIAIAQPGSGTPTVPIFEFAVMFTVIGAVVSVSP